LIVKLRMPLAVQVERAMPLAQMTLPLDQAPDTVRGFMIKYGVCNLAPLYPRLMWLKKLRGLTDAAYSEELRLRFAVRASRMQGTFQPPELSRTYLLELSDNSPANVAGVLARLKADSQVDYGEKNRIVSAVYTPASPYLLSSGSWGQAYEDLWGLKKIGAATAWNMANGEGVVVAVVDSGIDYEHPDIAANLWTNAREVAGNGVDDDQDGYVDDVRGWNFAYNTNDPRDDSGHGTHVAGTIAADANGDGTLGVAWSAKVMALKCLDYEGNGFDSDCANAILYAVQNGADIINLSWGHHGVSKTIADAVEYAYSLGAVIVAAAGDSGEDAWGFYPANLAETIAVAASDPEDAIAAFSNSGGKIDVAAPGVGILSLKASGTALGIPVANGYTVLQGTSMAAAHVSGAAALLLSQHPAYSNEQVRQVLRATAAPLGAFGGAPKYGYGRINVAAALARVAAAEVSPVLAPIAAPLTQGGKIENAASPGSASAEFTVAGSAGQSSTSSPAGTFTDIEAGAVSIGTTLLTTVTGDAGATINSAFTTHSVVEVDTGGASATTLITIPPSGTLRFRGKGVFTHVGIRFSDSTAGTSGQGNLQCPDGATLKLANGANTDSVSQTNFSGLTGTSNPFGVWRTSIQGCVIDGNAANNRSGYDVRLYGRAFRLDNVTLQNAAQGYLWTEGRQEAFTSQDAELECNLKNVHMVGGTRGTGWIDKGPNDLIAEGVVIWGASAWGLELYSALHASHLNTFLNGSGGIRTGLGGGILGNDIAGTTATGVGMLVDSGAGASSISNGTFAGPIGLQLNSQSQFITGLIANTTVAGVVFNGASANGEWTNLQFFNNSGPQVRFIDGGGASMLILTGDATDSGATLFGGAVPQNSIILSRMSGQTDFMQFSAAEWKHGGYTQKLPTGANSTFAILDLAQTWSKLQDFQSGIQVGGNHQFAVDSRGNLSTSGAVGAGSFNSGGTAGFTGTKTAGSCTFTIQGGIITNVSGC
jgi:subtilisin family serine protease